MFTEKMFQYLKYKLGGAKRYIGRDLTEVHDGMNISNSLYDKAVEIFIQNFKRLRPKLP